MDDHELRDMMFTAQQPGHGPIVIRYPRGASVYSDWQSPMKAIEIGKGRCLREGSDVAFVSLGFPGNDALAAADTLANEGISAAVYDMRFLKPLDAAILEEVSGCRVILTLEDGAMKGGLYGAVCEYFAGRENAPIVKGLGIPDHFIPQDTQKAQWAECCLDTDSIFALLVEVMKS
jgi:1-deoxy-D-xylulose-5-phosphate synthase